MNPNCACPLRKLHCVEYDHEPQLCLPSGSCAAQCRVWSSEPPTTYHTRKPCLHSLPSEEALPNCVEYGPEPPTTYPLRKLCSTVSSMVLSPHCAYPPRKLCRIVSSMVLSTFLAVLSASLSPSTGPGSGSCKLLCMSIRSLERTRLIT